MPNDGIGQRDEDSNRRDPMRLQRVILVAGYGQVGARVGRVLPEGVGRNRSQSKPHPRERIPATGGLLRRRAKIDFEEAEEQGTALILSNAHEQRVDPATFATAAAWLAYSVLSTPQALWLENSTQLKMVHPTKPLLSRSASALQFFLVKPPLIALSGKFPSRS